MFRCPRNGMLRLPQFWLWCLALEDTIHLDQREATVAYLAGSPAWRPMSERELIGHFRDPFGGKNQASFDHVFNGTFLAAQTAGFRTPTPRSARPLADVDRCGHRPRVHWTHLVLHGLACLTPAPYARPVHAWDLRSDDLVAAADRVDFPELLPKLLRRLIAATCPGASIDMPADGGIRLGGFDGIVVAPTSVAACPAGVSAWEALSARADADAKASEDFTKRSEAPSVAGIDPKATTYVALTGRRWSKARAWADERRRLGVWREVVALDAEAIAEWLERAPSVSMWLSGLLGHPRYGLVDVDEFVGRWSRRTSPALPIGLLTCGRERQGVCA